MQEDHVPVPALVPAIVGRLHAVGVVVPVRDPEIREERVGPGRREDLAPRPVPARRRRAIDGERIGRRERIGARCETPLHVDPVVPGDRAHRLPHEGLADALGRRVVVSAREVDARAVVVRGGGRHERQRQAGPVAPDVAVEVQFPDRGRAHPAGESAHRVRTVPDRRGAHVGVVPAPEQRAHEQRVLVRHVFPRSEGRRGSGAAETDDADSGHGGAHPRTLTAEGPRGPAEARLRVVQPVHLHAGVLAAERDQMAGQRIGRQRDIPPGGERRVARIARPGARIHPGARPEVEALQPVQPRRVGHPHPRRQDVDEEQQHVDADEDVHEPPRVRGGVEQQPDGEGVAHGRYFGPSARVPTLLVRLG